MFPHLITFIKQLIEIYDSWKMFLTYQNKCWTASYYYFQLFVFVCVLVKWTIKSRTYKLDLKLNKSEIQHNLL